MTRKWNTTKWNFNHAGNVHYSEVIMSAMASQITGVLIVCLNVCSVADRRKHQSSMSLAFVRGIHRWQVNSPHKGPVTRKMFPFDDVIMEWKSFGEMGPRTLRQPNLRKVRRPTVPWKGRNESPLIDIHSSIKAIHQSVIDIMDIHNSNMDAVFPLTHNRCEVVISWWSPLLPKISIYATKCESILEKSGIFIHLQSKYCINLSYKKNLTISWVQIAARW